MISRTTIIPALLLAALALAAPPALSRPSSSAPRKYENWKVYPAFNREPLRIIDTPDAAYFLVLQSYFQRNTVIYDRVRTAIFKYDYSKPEAGINNISDKMLRGDAYPVLTDYNAANGSLFIVYSDGRTQILFTDGRSVTGDPLPDLPGNAEIRSLTFGQNEAVVTTGYGLVCYNPDDGTITRRLETGDRFDAAALCGDKIVTIRDNKVFVADAPPDSRISNLRPLSVTGEGTIGNALSVVPLNSSSVAVVSGQHYSQALDILTFKSDGWHRTRAADINMELHDDGTSVTGSLESNIIPNRDGYLLYGSNWACQLYRSATTDTPIENMLTRVDYVTDSYPAVGSWDFRRFWKYRHPGHFNTGTLSETEVTWRLNSESIRPNAPAMLMTSEIAYSPKFGLTAASQNLSWTLNDGVKGIPATLASFKDNKWNILTPNYNPPVAIEGNTELSNLYYNNPYSFPASFINGVQFDPENPDYAFCGSWFNGTFAFNAENPSADFMMFAQDINSLNKFPGFKAMFPTNLEYEALCACSNVQFDNNGDMYVTYLDFDKSVRKEEAISLNIWPSANRRATLSSNSVSKTEKWLSITVPTTYSEARHKLCVLKHNSNNNKFVIGLAIGKICVFDHKGTLHNTADDVLKIINTVTDQHGTSLNVEQYFSIKEDPVSGVVWVAGDNGMAGFNPHSEVTDGRIAGHTVEISDGVHPSNPFAGHIIHDICFDDLNRMWVATRNNGVWGISADRRSVVVHYTTENSGLPSDYTYSVCWNPDEHTLLVSTDGGFAEVSPDNRNGSSTSVGTIHVYPKATDPSFGGEIMISGAMSGEIIVVKDAGGNEKARVCVNADGRASWNTLCADGTEAPTGTYVLTSLTERFYDTEITIIR